MIISTKTLFPIFIVILEVPLKNNVILLGERVSTKDIKIQGGRVVSQNITLDHEGGGVMGDYHCIMKEPKKTKEILLGKL